MNQLKNEKFVFDNAVLSNFARIKKLELIFYLSKKIFTTREVIDKIKQGISKKPSLFDVIKLVQLGKIKIATLQEESSILLMNRLMREGRLGLGEISAMVLAEELNGVFITDDEVAAKKAIDFKIKALSNSEHRDTVIFLIELRKKRVISNDEYKNIKKMLEQENFKI